MSLNQIIKGTPVPLPLEALSIQLTLGAHENYVLTSDANGNGTWQPSGGGGGGVASLTLAGAPNPLVLTGTSSNPILGSSGNFGTLSIMGNNVAATGAVTANGVVTAGNGTPYPITLNSGVITGETIIANGNMQCNGSMLCLNRITASNGMGSTINLYGTNGNIAATGDINGNNVTAYGNLLVSAGGGFGSYTSLDNGAITTDGLGTLSGVGFTASASVTAEGGGVATNSVSSPAGGGVGNLVAQSLITTGALVTSTGLQTTGVSATGIWGTNQPCNVSFYKLGNTVTMALSAVLALANNAAVINLGTVPLGVLTSPFPPPNLAWALSTTAYTNDRQLNFPILITDNSVDFTGECILVFDGLGNVAISVTGAYGGNFSGLSTSGSSGFYNSTFSWLTDA